MAVAQSDAQLQLEQQHQQQQEQQQQQQQQEQQQQEMEIAFYDLETTVPVNGQAFEILEFAAVVVSATRFNELDCFSTLVRPSSLSHVTKRSIECNGILPQSLENVPSFCDIADRVFALLDGRVWAGHNILCFDNLRLREAFASIGKPPPQAAGYIDTLQLLRRTFGKRADNYKMATLAAYFGLGKQEHRSLADVRLNIKVLTSSATVMFLENYFPDIYGLDDSKQTMVLRSHKSPASSQKSPVLQSSPASQKSPQQAASFPASSQKSPVLQQAASSVVTSSPVSPALECRRSTNGFDMGSLAAALEEAACLPLPLSRNEEEDNMFVHPQDVSLNLLKVKPQGVGQQFLLMNGAEQQLRIKECGARVRFSVSDKFAFSDNGKPSFNIVVIPSPQIIAIVKECEALVKRHTPSLTDDMWRRVLVGFAEEPGVRIKIGTTGQGAGAKYTTRVLKNGKDVVSEVHVKSFLELVPVGCVLDVAFSVLAYAYPGGYAGLQLLADHLVIDPVS